jgi:hypothetical protein
MTGNFTNWDGDLTAVGPIYPFPGSEVLLVIILLVLWIVWHILQIRMENRQMDNEARALRQGDALQRTVESEHTIERM